LAAVLGSANGLWAAKSAVLQQYWVGHCHLVQHTHNKFVLMFMGGHRPLLCLPCSCSQCTRSSQRVAPVFSLKLYSCASSWCCMWQPVRAGHHCIIAVGVLSGQYSGRRARVCCLTQLCSLGAVCLFSNHAWVGFSRRKDRGTPVYLPRRVGGLYCLGRGVGLGGCDHVARLSALFACNTFLDVGCWHWAAKLTPRTCNTS
jgi:hypothetical protein